MGGALSSTKDGSSCVRPARWFGCPFWSIAQLLARLVLAGVFVWAGLPKIADPINFASSIEAYQVIRGDLVLWVALLLPWLEVVLGIGLLTPWLKLACKLAMAGLLLLFIGLHTSAWARGLDVNCGCFGLSEESPDYLWWILRNLGLLALCGFLLLSRDRTSGKA
ncbi:MAG: MauE/DoxX family redox-associated membrane protein [Opitutales bacterium]